MNLPEKFNHLNQTNQKSLIHQQPGRAAPRRRARFLGALLLLASGSLLGAPPSHADDGHATYLSSYVHIKSVNTGSCWIQAGAGYDVWHQESDRFHFMGGGRVYCADQLAHSITLTVIQERDTNGRGTRGGVVEVGERGSFYGTGWDVFEHTGPACQGGSTVAAFRTVVYATIDGVQYNPVANQWKDPPNGCLHL